MALLGPHSKVTDRQRRECRWGSAFTEDEIGYLRFRGVAQVVSYLVYPGLSKRGK